MSRLDYKGSQPTDPIKTPFSIQRPATPGGCLSLIEKQTSDGTTNLFDFQGISPSFTDLRMRLMGTVNIGAGGVGAVYMQFNGDTAGNYRHAIVDFANSITPLTAPEIVYEDVDGDIGFDLRGPTFSGFSFAQAPGIVEMLIAEYSSTAFWKVAQGMGHGIAANSDGSIYAGQVGLQGGYWMNTAAITSIQVGTVTALGGGGGGEVFLAGTTCTLHGIC